MAKKTDKKTFYSVEVELFEGSQFDKDEDVKYYQDYETADDAFERAKKDMCNQFETAYDIDDGIGIVVYEKKLADGTKICTINGKNLADETDTCKIKMRTLTMN